MKITKSRLEEIIKEEIQRNLEELDAPSSSEDPASSATRSDRFRTGSSATASGKDVKTKTDVERAGAKVEKAPGLETYLQKIDNRIELEQFLGVMLKQVSPKLGPDQMYMALTRAAKLVKKEG